MTKKFVFSLQLLAAILLLFSGAFAQAAHVACGDTIVADTTLDTDLLCAPGVDGLIIGANGVTLDLNAFTITGSGEAAGVVNYGFNHVTIKKGVITGFDVGVVAFDVTDLKFRGLALSNQIFTSVLIINGLDVEISDIFIALPPGGGLPVPSTEHFAEAIRLADVDNARVKNVTVDGGYFGVLSIGVNRISTNLKVEDSVFTNIGETGVRIVNIAGAKVQGNTISGADMEDGCYAGIDVLGEGSNTRVHIVKNVVSHCGSGIFTASGRLSTKFGIMKNRLHANGTGIQLNELQDSSVIGNWAALNGDVGVGLDYGSIGNKILHNTAFGNGGVDMFHSDSSTLNMWLGNVCGTSFGSDVDCP